MNKSYEELGEIVHRYEQIGTDDNDKPIMHDMAFEECLLESESMNYGRICGMLNWCYAQGPVDPPWEVFNWKGLKLWWLIPIPVILMIGGIIAGRAADLMIVIGMLLLFVVAFLSLRFSRLKHDKKGKCIMCGKASDPKYDKPIKKKRLTLKGWKTKRVSKSSYCSPCAKNTDRQTIWRDIENVVWKVIAKNSTKEKTFLRMIAYAIPPPFGATEYFTDPRKIGKVRASKYSLKDRMNPKDYIPVKTIRDMQRRLRLMDTELEHLANAIEAGEF